jgi:hypothetical protein
MKNCTKCNEIIISNKSKDICINCIREEKNIITILKTKRYKNKRYNDEEIDIIIKNLRNYTTLKNYIKEFEIKKYEKAGVICINNCKNFPCIECKKLYNSNKFKGENNPFFGKTHTDEIKKQMKESWSNPSEKKQKYIDYLKSNENKERLSSLFSGENNPNYGRTGGFKETWIEKFGVESGTTKYEEWINTQKNNSSGENNPMFGKPSPQGSGNGWSGHYIPNGWFFRSLFELSYMVNVIVKENLSWENGELKKYKIPYVDYEGIKRNYFPDFVINGNKIIEIKPSTLINSPKVLNKIEGVKKYCKENNYTFEIITPEKLSSEEILSLYNSGDIKFTERYETKFKSKYTPL